MRLLHLIYPSLDRGLQRLPLIFLKKTSGGVSWRWHGESYRKGKNTHPLRLFPSFWDTFSCIDKLVSSGLTPWICQHSVAVSLRPAMAAHKPVEWVQAVITRFDEQVRWVDSVDGCSNLWYPQAPPLWLTCTQKWFFWVTTMFGRLLPFNNSLSLHCVVYGLSQLQCTERGSFFKLAPSL